MKKRIFTTLLIFTIMNGSLSAYAREGKEDHFKGRREEYYTENSTDFDFYEEEERSDKETTIMEEESVITESEKIYEEENTFESEEIYKEENTIEPEESYEKDEIYEETQVLEEATETTTEKQNIETDTEYVNEVEGNGNIYIDNDVNVSIGDNSYVENLNVDTTIVNNVYQEGDTYNVTVIEEKPDRKNYKREDDFFESKPQKTNSAAVSNYNLYIDNSVTVNAAQVITLSIGSNAISVDGKTKYADASPYIQNSSSSTMLPLRAVSEALEGASVNWNAQTKTAIVSYKDKTLYFPINENYYIDTVNGMLTNANSAITEIKDNRTFLPVRTLSNALDLNIEWLSNTKTVRLSSK